jgi:hypothetical protein
MKKLAEKQIVIYDATYGYGPHFELAQAVWNTKTLTLYAGYGSGILRRHQRRTQVFAVATPELATEAKAINALYADLWKRARAFKEKLRAAQPE